MLAQSANTESAAMADRVYRTLPAIAALLYPGLVWSGPAVYSPLLLLSLLPSVLCVVVAHRPGVADRFPLAARVAYFGAGATGVGAMIIMMGLIRASIQP